MTLAAYKLQQPPTWRRTRILRRIRSNMVIVDPSITAKSERLLIRPLVMDDAADIVLMRSNPEVMKHT